MACGAQCIKTGSVNGFGTGCDTTAMCVLETHRRNADKQASFGDESPGRSAAVHHWLQLWLQPNASAVVVHAATVCNVPTDD